MPETAELLLALILVSDLVLVASSRLLHCIKVAGIQGLLIGLLPLAVWQTGGGISSLQLWGVALTNTLVKGIALPALMVYAMRQASVKRELEPFIGYPLSVAIQFLIVAASFLASSRLHIADGLACALTIPVALSTIGAGLFMIIARRKAITQVIGFLMLENGITVFGAGLMMEYGIFVELGILLDVLVLVFVMGIAIFQINREFAHIDTDRLNRLGDTTTRR